MRTWFWRVRCSTAGRARRAGTLWARWGRRTACRTHRFAAWQGYKVWIGPPGCARMGHARSANSAALQHSRLIVPPSTACPKLRCSPLVLVLLGGALQLRQASFEVLDFDSLDGQCQDRSCNLTLDGSRTIRVHHQLLQSGDRGACRLL